MQTLIRADRCSLHKVLYKALRHKLVDAPEGEGTSPVLITETHAGPPRRIISPLMHSRAHNFQIKLSGLRLGDHGNRTSVHNGRNCSEREDVFLPF